MPDAGSEPRRGSRPGLVGGWGGGGGGDRLKNRPHLADLAAGYFKDPVKRDEYVDIVHGWQQETAALAKVLKQGV